MESCLRANFTESAVWNVLRAANGEQKLFIYLALFVLFIKGGRKGKGELRMAAN